MQAGVASTHQRSQMNTVAFSGIDRQLFSVYVAGYSEFLSDDASIGVRLHPNLGDLKMAMELRLL